MTVMHKTLSVSPVRILWHCDPCNQSLWHTYSNQSVRAGKMALRPKGHSDNAQRSIKTPQQLRRVIAKLSPASPATDRFSAMWRAQSHKKSGQQEQRKVWYRTQHEHWLA